MVPLVESMACDCTVESHEFPDFESDDNILEIEPT